MSDADAVHCATLLREHDFSRYAATLFVPPDKRRALLALFAFNLDIARIPDQVSQPLPGEIRLQWWTDLLEGLDHGGVEGHPVAAELMRAIRTHALPTGPLLSLIEARKFDLYNDPMPTLVALETYLDDTVSSLFSTAARILTSASEEIGHVARHDGIAQGLVRVLQRLPRDAARRQLYLPEDILAQHNANDAHVFTGERSPAIDAVCAQLVVEAQSHRDAALDLLKGVPAEAKPAFLPLALMSHDLHTLSATGRDVFKPIEPPSRLRVLWTLWRASKSALFR
jgi:phytoene synthase